MISFLNSFKFAFKGMKLAFEVDRNVKLHIISGIIVLIISFLLKISKFEFIFILFSIFFVFITEMVNTAIEEMTNLIKVEHSREAMIAKDVAAAAVLLSAIFAAITGFLIFTPYILAIFQQSGS